MPFSWKDFASKWFRCKLVVCWDWEPRALDIASGCDTWVQAGGFLAVFLLMQVLLFFICKVCAVGEQSYRLWLGLGFWPGLSGYKGRERKTGWGWGLLEKLLHVHGGGCWVQGGSLKLAVDWALVLQKNVLGKSNGYAICMTESRKARTPLHVFLLRQNSSDIHEGNITLNHLRTEVYLQGIIAVQMIARALILAQIQNWANTSTGLVN